MADNEQWHRASAGPSDAPAILLVDDEPAVLDTLSHQLRREYRIVTAEDGTVALEVLAGEGPFAAVISDMRMPRMDGIELLGRVRTGYPDTTRVLHTSQADVTSAISAINDGQVYRFIRKPSSTAELRRTARDAVEHHHLALAERQILDKTLRTSLQALFGCLQLASPQAFARAGRIRNLVGALCTQLALDNAWEIEVAAMASQLGTVTLPPSVLQKLDRGLPLTEDEQRMIDALPKVAVQLLGDIPRLDDVVEIVRCLHPAPARSAADRARRPLVDAGVKVLRTAIEVENLESRGVGTDGTVAVLERDGGHDAEVLAALRRVRQVTAGQDTMRAYRIGELRTGMRIMEDVLAVNGPVLIGRGMVVTEVLLGRLSNFKRMGQVAEPILATIPPARLPVA